MFKEQVLNKTFQKPIVQVRGYNFEIDYFIGIENILSQMWGFFSLSTGFN